MVDAAVTALQLFGIGLGIGLSTQCFFVCAPLVVPYVAAVEDGWRKAIRDLAILVGGRLLAYIFLGAAVGASAGHLDRVLASSFAGYVRAASGVVLVVLGLMIALGINPRIASCAFLRRSGLSRGGLFLIGIAMGLVPCVPLVSVLLEVSLMSKTALAGAAYTLFFGLGTALATFVTVGPLAGVANHLVGRFTASKPLMAGVRAVCGLLLVLYGAMCLWRVPAADAAEIAYYRVARVIDGDTIALSDGRRVRLTGIDTPEVRYGRKLKRDARRTGLEAGELRRLGARASDFTRKACLGKRVRLEYDVDRKDIYGRTLAYVYLEDGTFLNAAIVKAGYAQPMTVPPNVKYADEFVRLAREAREAGRGLWGEEKDRRAKEKDDAKI